jgi:gamma-glutamyl-gamma-aminobutyrate hydrolase PuuD
MKIILSLFLLFSFVTRSLACDLPSGESLNIGCGYTCDFSYRLRLKLASIVLGYPVNIINMRWFDLPGEALDEVDAVLVPGGADIDPKFYMDAVTPELAQYTKENLKLVEFSEEGEYRDQFEYDMIKTYSSEKQYEKLPMLGVCRGMQMMSVAQGIPLYLDIQTELGIKNRYYVFDRINVKKQDSLMTSFYGDKKRKGFKEHHQGIRMSYYNAHQGDYPLTKVTATSNKGLIAEALEYTHRPALGVQFHPEKSLPRTSFPIYKWFLTKACEYKKSKDQQ